MSAVQHIAFNDTVSVNDNATSYVSVSGSGTNGTEANREVPIRVAGDFAKLFANVFQNDLSNTANITLRKSRAGTALTLNVGAGTTGLFENTSDSVAFAATDEADYEIVAPTETGVHTIQCTTFGAVFTPSSGTYLHWASGQGQNVSVDSNTLYLPISDNGTVSSANEANVEWPIQTTFTLRNFFVTISANARTTNTVYRTRVNRGDGAQSVTFGSGETGLKEDGSNTDSVVAGDEANLAIVTSTGGGTITSQNMGLIVESASSEFPAAAQSTLSQVFNVTNYLQSGDLASPRTTESQAQLTNRIVGLTISKLATYVSANSIATSATVLRTRVNGGNGAQSVSYAAGETGQKVDASNSDSLADGDEWNYQVVTPNTSGGITVRQLGVTAATAVAAGQPTMRRWGGVPYLGGGGIGQKGLRAAGSGRAWGRAA
jgi:hypothetical protein